ncbi:MAG: phosphatase PAP2 family protein [Telmatospirillum sp.]|nr:phosphatase PAP2 family protein [Telmatospirillum sp.]
MWTFITDFGDSAVTLPLTVLVAAYLALVKRPQLFWSWSLAVGGTGGIIAILKLLLGSCGQQWNGLASVMVSPSGHTAMSTVVYGCFAGLAGRHLSPGPRLLLRSATALWIGLIAISRLILSAHTLPEVITGFVFGGLAVAGFSRATRAEGAVPLHLWRLVVVSAILVAAVHGTKWPIETTIKELALSLRGQIPACH